MQNIVVHRYCRPLIGFRIYLRRNFAQRSALDSLHRSFAKIDSDRLDTIFLIYIGDSCRRHLIKSDDVTSIFEDASWRHFIVFDRVQYALVERVVEGLFW